MKANRLFISALVSSALMSAGAMAADGTINFSGSITASACETIVGAVQDGNSTPSLTATVNLLSATSDAFATVGSIVNKTPFSIQLSGCAASTGAENVRALFSGTAPVAGEPNLLANTGGATNVGIVILNSAGTSEISLNQSNPSPDDTTINLDEGAAMPSTSGDVTLRYQAAYKASALPVGEGTVTSQATYVINYF